MPGKQTIASKIDSLKEEGARFRFDFSRWEWISIPIPPLEIQDEIIRLLNKFTELKSTLVDELAAREKQYNYYRKWYESEWQETKWQESICCCL